MSPNLHESLTAIKTLKNKKTLSSVSKIAPEIL